MKIVASLALVLATTIGAAHACEHLDAPIFEIVDEDDRWCAYADFNSRAEAEQFLGDYLSENRKSGPSGVSLVGFTPAVESAPAKRSMRTPKALSTEGLVRVGGSCIARCWGVR